jgi:hypothetical protein
VKSARETSPLLTKITDSKSETAVDNSKTAVNMSELPAAAPVVVNDVVLADLVRHALRCSQLAPA